MRFFYFIMLAFAASYLVLNVVLYVWVYASTKDFDLTFSLVNENVREDKRLTPSQILLLDVTNRMRYLIVIGVLFSVLVDVFFVLLRVNYEWCRWCKRCRIMVRQGSPERSRRVHHEWNQPLPFILDCMDAGGRATHGAVAESLSKDLSKNSNNT